eukprot:1326953-Amorphochlora_amoeboformis.AAC.2
MAKSIEPDAITMLRALSTEEICPHAEYILDELVYHLSMTHEIIGGKESIVAQITNLRKHSALLPKHTISSRTIARELTIRSKKMIFLLHRGNPTPQRNRALIVAMAQLMKSAQKAREELHGLIGDIYDALIDKDDYWRMLNKFRQVI